MLINKKEYKLEEVCIKITDGAHQSPKSVLDGLPMASVKDMTDYGLNLDSARKISLQDYEALVKQGCKPEKGDVLIAKDGSVLEVICSVDEDINVVLLSSIAILRPNPLIIDTCFLKYYLRSPNNLNYMKAHFVSGAVIQRVVLKDFKKVAIEIPDLVFQKKISKILDTLDKKILNLKQTNQTLESIAKAIFKSWFIDFDPVRAKQQGKECAGIDKAAADLFPNSFVESELGLIPKGWERSSMGKVSRVSIGKTPPRKEKEWFTKNNKDIRWLSIRDMGNKFVFFNNSSEYLTRDAIKRFNVKVVPDNTVLMSFKMTIGRVGITFGEITTNEAIAHFNLDEGAALTSEYIYLWLKLFNFSTLSSTSSIADAVNSQSVRSIPITIPSKKTLERFQTLISPIFKSIKNNELTIQTLTDIRDTLLPRLISGKLDLSKIEEQIEGVA